MLRLCGVVLRDYSHTAISIKHYHYFYFRLSRLGIQDSSISCDSMLDRQLYFVQLSRNRRDIIIICSHRSSCKGLIFSPDFNQTRTWSADFW